MILANVDEVTQDWPVELQRRLVATVAQIAAAERARAARKPEVLGETYRAVAVEGMQAARLAQALVAGFRDLSPLAVLVQQLRAFTSAALNESIRHDSVFAVWSSSEMLNEFQGRRTTAVTNTLIADLVVIALGREPRAAGEPFTENTIRRRYRPTAPRKPSGRTTAATAVWRDGWDELKELARSARASIASMSEQDRAAAETMYKSQYHIFESAIRMRFELDAASRPARGRRDSDIASQQLLNEARELRTGLTRDLQASRLAGPTTYGTEIRRQVGQMLADRSGADQRQLLSQISLIIKQRSSSVKPSEVAARIVALKYGLSLRNVRTGRSASKRERRRVPSPILAVANITAAEHVAERRRRGRKHPPIDFATESRPRKRQR